MTKFMDKNRCDYFNDCKIVNENDLSKELKNFIELTGMKIRVLQEPNLHQYAFILGGKYLEFDRIDLKNPLLVSLLKEEFKIK